MRQIGNLQDEKSAKTFIDYLYHKGIESETEQSREGSWVIWVLSDDKLKEAASLMEIYRLNPNLPEYQQISGHAERHRKLKQEQDEAFQKKIYDRDRIVTWQTQIGLLSAIMIAVSATVFILSFFEYNESLIHALSITRHDIITPSVRQLPEVFSGEVWRIITPIFLHFGILHLFFNMLWLKDLGTAIEKRHSSMVLFVMVIAIASISNVAQYITSGPGFGGMSGVVYGLFGYIWMQSKYNPASGFHLDKQIVTMMIAWFFLCLSGLIGPIANTAHGVGMLTGMAIGYVTALISKRS